MKNHAISKVAVLFRFDIIKLNLLKMISDLSTVLAPKKYTPKNFRRKVPHLPIPKIKQIIDLERDKAVIYSSAKKIKQSSKANAEILTSLCN